MDTTKVKETARPVRAQASSARALAANTRVSDEAAFVLHSYPYKETSLIIDILTRSQGRLALVARGAKRPRSALRGVLLGFQPLALSFIHGRSKGSELGILTRAEWVGGLPALRGQGLLCGFYLNELLIKMLAREDPHETLFEAYYDALRALSLHKSAAPVLRNFEYTLLREIGYALQLKNCDDTGAVIQADTLYRYVPERGPMTFLGGEGVEPGPVVMGKTLLDIEAGDYSDPTTLWQSKLLTRQLLNHHLAGQTLHTRQMMMELQAL